MNPDDIAKAKILAKRWRSLVCQAVTIEDIEQEILLAQLEFEAGVRKKNPQENLGSLFCQLSIGNQYNASIDENEQLVAIGTNIEHIDPILLLEMVQDVEVALLAQNACKFKEIATADLVKLLNISDRQARNIKKSLVAVSTHG
jgi:hypothetical protein